MTMKLCLARLVFITGVIGLTACSTLPTDVQRAPSFAIPDTVSTPIARDVQPLLEAHPGQSGFHLLPEGADAFAMRMRLIEAAEESIDAQYYIWHDDLTGNALYNRILVAADRGVRVRLLLDDLDTAGKDPMLSVIDAHPNIEVRLYNPFANRTRRVGDLVTDTRRINHRMHNKTLTVDNQASIFGGRNVGDEYFSAAEDVGFGDMDALAIGPVVPEISAQFDLYWNSELAYPIAVLNKDMATDSAAVEAFRSESDAQVLVARDSEYGGIIRQLGSAEPSRLSEFDYAWSDWVLAYDQPSKVEATQVSADTHLAPKLREGMDRTQEDLIIVSPYFVPGPEFTQYLIELVDRGVQVRVLTNSLQANDVSMVHAGYMRYREDLIAGGVELYEFKAVRDVAREEEEGRNRIGASRASLHAKFFGFDQQYLFVGSFNLDARSVALNTEFGAYFKSPESARALSGIFDDEIMQFAYRVLLDENGDLVWVTMDEGEEIRVDHEPDTTFWKRFNTRLMSVFVPESQL